jgi:hypothetical protein
MRRILAILITLTVLAPRLGAAGLQTGGAQAKPNFSGEWIVDIAKSDFGPVGGPASMTRTIKHAEPVIESVIIQKGGATGDVKLESRYTTDGKPQKNDYLGTPITTVGRWDGTTLILNTTMSVQGTEVKVEDRWVLSADGKTLTVSRNFDTGAGSMASRVIFTKKQ